ncbi:AlpA family phage regulatory protein [Burkholderia gladioli]|uniref:AlpA family phage regulatory protein n=1 Tax=Burkholderia gladioli TaxID=28095 RepID=UPI0016417866|nr:AlpA family phage regulatory protein [Burkholderia gladioli]
MTKQLQSTIPCQLNSPRCDVSTDAILAVRQLDKAPRILRMKQLIERTNLSRATLYVLMSSEAPTR